jgi:hypothetical protein
MKKKDKNELRLRTVESHIHVVMGGIAEAYVRGQGDSPLIKSFLHKITLNSSWDTFLEDNRSIQNIWGNLYLNPSFVPAQRMPSYNEQYIKKGTIYDVIIFKDPASLQPPLRIEIIPHEKCSALELKISLSKIAERMPDLSVSSVEYTTDIFCYSPQAVEMLFKDVVKFIYVPYKRASGFLNDDQDFEWGDTVRINRVFRSNPKVYERGPDTKKRNGQWIYPDMDRVRLEHTLNREKLSKYNIKTLADLIRNPKFYEINKDVYQFRCFEKSNVLPKPWQKYTAAYFYGNCSSLCLEMRERRGSVKGINQYVRDFRPLNTLLAGIHDSMKKFDSEWSE